MYIKKFWIFILFLSLCWNAFFFVSQGVFELSRWKDKRIEEGHQSPLTDISVFENSLYKGGMHIIETGSKPFTPKKMGGVIDNLNYNFKGYSKDELYTTSEMGYLMMATLEEAVKRDDKEALDKIKKVFDKYVLNEELKNVDQCLYGIVAIGLYKATKEMKYRNYINAMATWLNELYIPNVGILYRKGSSCNFVDGLGMYIPFLMEYSRFSHQSKYEDIAMKCFENYINDGVDHSTGIAYHGYSINSPKIKMGSANWGRGNAWMALAMVYLPIEKMPEGIAQICKKFQETMMSIYESQGEIRQFINDGLLDLSATIPILYSLDKDRCLKVDKLLYSKYLREDILYFSSGPTTTINDYSPYRGPNMLSQAIMLKWLIECK